MENLEKILFISFNCLSSITGKLNKFLKLSLLESNKFILMKWRKIYIEL